MKCCKTETPGALRIVNSSGGRDRELRDVPKALHNAEQLPRLNLSRAVPRRLPYGTVQTRSISIVAKSSIG